MLNYALIANLSQTISVNTDINKEYKNGPMSYFCSGLIALGLMLGLIMFYVCIGALNTFLPSCNSICNKIKRSNNIAYSVVPTTDPSINNDLQNLTEPLAPNPNLLKNIVQPPDILSAVNNEARNN